MFIVRPTHQSPLHIEDRKQAMMLAQKISLSYPIQVVVENHDKDSPASIAQFLNGRRTFPSLF